MLVQYSKSKTADIVEVEFYNEDATPRVTRFRVQRSAVPSIALWYGAFYAGDDYGLKVGGEVVPLGPNGEVEANA